MKEHIEIQIRKYQSVQKCKSCDRVRDIYYNLIVKDYEDKDLVVANMELCRNCGDNFNKILGNQRDLGEKLIKTFEFGRK